MKKVIRLTESELIRIVKRVIKENNAPERYVIDVETGKMVGTHQYGVGFTVNKIGERMGYESDPVSIPDGTKMEDNDNSPMRMRSIGRAEMPPMRRYNDLGEQHHITNNSDFSYPEDPNKFNEYHIEDIFEVASSIREANNMIKDYYPGFYFDKTYETDYGKTMAFFSPEGKEIAGKYIVGCCGGAGNLENLERFRRSNNDAIYNPRKRY